MKRVFFSAIALVLILGSCVSSPKGKGVCKNNCCAKSEIPADCTKMIGDNSEKTICGTKHNSGVVEVLYFHEKQRSEVCQAMEDLTTEVIQTKFSKELKERKLQLSIIDISTPEGLAIASEYEVTRTSLILNKWVEGKPNLSDITPLGLTKAQSQPEEFKRLVEIVLVQMLK